MSERRDRALAFATHPEIMRLADTFVDAHDFAGALRVKFDALSLSYTEEELRAVINEAYKRNAQMLRVA